MRTQHLNAQVLDVSRDAIFTLVVMSSPVMLVGLAVGLAISLLQALTQIQEMTLDFRTKNTRDLHFTDRRLPITFSNTGSSTNGRRCPSAS